MTLVRWASAKHRCVQFQLKRHTVMRSTHTADNWMAERVAARIRTEAHERIILGKKKQITRHIRPSLPLAAVQSAMLEDYR